MKKITLSADEDLIDRARRVARSRHTTLNAAFREWLEQFAVEAGDGKAVNDLMRHYRHVHSTGPYSRDEMNERRANLKGVFADIERIRKRARLPKRITSKDLLSQGRR